METTASRSSFRWRAFSALVMGLTGLLLPLSGWMNHSLQFETLTTARHFWMAVHNSAALLFVLSAVLHLSYNARALLHYVRRAKERLLSREALTAVLLVLLLSGLFSLHAFHAGQG